MMFIVLFMAVGMVSFFDDARCGSGVEEAAVAVASRSAQAVDTINLIGEFASYYGTWAFASGYGCMQALTGVRDALRRLKEFWRTPVDVVRDGLHVLSSSRQGRAFIRQCPMGVPLQVSIQVSEIPVKFKEPSEKFVNFLISDKEACRAIPFLNILQKEGRSHNPLYFSGLIMTADWTWGGVNTKHERTLVVGTLNVTLSGKIIYDKCMQDFFWRMSFDGKCASDGDRFVQLHSLLDRHDFLFDERIFGYVVSGNTSAMACSVCNMWTLSQEDPMGTPLSQLTIVREETFVRMARRLRKSELGGWRLVRTGEAKSLPSGGIMAVLSKIGDVNFKGYDTGRLERRKERMPMLSITDYQACLSRTANFKTTRLDEDV